MKEIFKIVAPQINVNDETVEFIYWKVENGSYVTVDNPICEIETVKALFEITAEADGIIHQIASPHTIVNVGECLGLIGKDQGSINRYLSGLDKKKITDIEKNPRKIKATVKARELAARHNVSLDEVFSIGVKGTIKETDVLKFLSIQKKIDLPVQKLTGQNKIATNDTIMIPPHLLARIEQEGYMAHQKMFMAKKLKNSLTSKLLTTIDAEMDLTSVNAFITRCKKNGQRLSLLHIVMHALNKTLSKYRIFTTFHFHNQLLRYRDIDIAFIVKTFDGSLYAPVVRKIDKLDIQKLAHECNTLTLKANRHQLTIEEMEGACFTVSCLPHSTIRRFVALIDEFQSAILAIAGEKNVVRLDKEKITEAPTVTLTLSYDHTIIDGWDSALFLEYLNTEMDRIVNMQ